MTIRVMVFSAGEMNSVELCLALSRQVNVELYGASSFERMGRHLFKNYRNDLPLISAPNFSEELQAQLDEWKIDILIPTHDSIVEYISDNRIQFECKMLIPSEKTSRACREKKYTMELFKNCDFIPTIFATDADLPNETFFVKPNRGQGSVGARVIKPDSPGIAEIDWDNELVCEYLPGDELTVDCFTDRHGALIGVFPRSRDRVLGGISVAGRTLAATAEICEIADRINAELDFLGLWFFQIKQAMDGSWKLLEISARCSGTQCLTRARGVNLPLLSVYAAMGMDVSVYENDIPIKMDRMLVPMFDFDYDIGTAYIDYDHTLVHSNGVDPEIIGLLYQFKRQDVRIVLITRHAHDLNDNLRKHCLSQSLFNEIVHINDKEPKSTYMDPKNAIFIDNAFTERLEVKQKLGIPVFDVEGAQVLKGWIQ